MSVKQGFDQHQLLHAHWPSDCCLCKYEKEVKRLQEHSQWIDDNATKLLRESDATIATLRADNLLLVKRASALRKLNIAYRLGDQKLADAALTELEALDTAQEEK